MVWNRVKSGFFVELKGLSVISDFHPPSWYTRSSSRYMLALMATLIHHPWKNYHGVCHHPFATGHKRRGPRVRVGSWSIFDTISILGCIAAAVSHLPVTSHVVQNLPQPKATFEYRCLLVFGWHAVCPTHQTNIRVSAVFIVYHCTMQRTKHVTEMHALKRIMSIMPTRIWWNLVATYQYPSSFKKISHL